MIGYNGRKEICERDVCECLLIEGLHTYEMNDRYVPDFHWCWVCKGSDEVSLRILRKDEQETTKKAPYLPSIGHTKEKK